MAATMMRPGAPPGSGNPPPALVAATNVPGAFSCSEAAAKPGAESFSEIGVPGAAVLWYM